MPSYSRRVEIPGKSSQELYQKVSTEIDRFLEKASVGKFDLDCDPGSRKVFIKSAMFSATLTCEEGALDLDAKLSLMAVPFRSKIDEGINRWIFKTFNVQV